MPAGTKSDEGRTCNHALLSEFANTVDLWINTLAILLGSGRQWFSNLSVQQNHLEGWMKLRLQAWQSDLVFVRLGLGICISSKFTVYWCCGLQNHTWRIFALRSRNILIIWLTKQPVMSSNLSVKTLLHQVLGSLRRFCPRNLRRGWSQEIKPDLSALCSEVRLGGRDREKGRGPPQALDSQDSTCRWHH